MKRLGPAVATILLASACAGQPQRSPASQAAADTTATRSIPTANADATADKPAPASGRIVRQQGLTYAVPEPFVDVGEAHFGYEGDASITVKIEARSVYRATRRYRGAAIKKYRKDFGLERMDQVIIAGRPGLLIHKVDEDGRHKLIGVFGNQKQSAIVVCSFAARLADELGPQLRQMLLQTRWDAPPQQDAEDIDHDGLTVAARPTSPETTARLPPLMYRDAASKAVGRLDRLMELNARLHRGRVAGLIAASRLQYPAPHEKRTVTQVREIEIEGHRGLFASGTLIVNGEAAHWLAMTYGERPYVEAFYILDERVTARQRKLAAESLMTVRSPHLPPKKPPKKAAKTSPTIYGGRLDPPADRVILDMDGKAVLVPEWPNGDAIPSADLPRWLQTQFRSGRRTLDLNHDARAPAHEVQRVKDAVKAAGFALTARMTSYPLHVRAIGVDGVEIEGATYRGSQLIKRFKAALVPLGHRHLEHQPGPGATKYHADRVRAAALRAGWPLGIHPPKRPPPTH